MASTRSQHRAALAVAAAAGAILTTSAQHFTEWSSPANLGAIVNSAFFELDPALSRDGLSLYFASDRPGGTGGTVDLWVAQRDSLEDPWQTPIPLPSTVNSPTPDLAPALSPGGHLLFLASDRPGGCGGRDLWVSFRTNKRDDFAWQPPQNLGCIVNSSGFDGGPAYVEEDEGGVILYFASLNRPGGVGSFDIWTSAMNADGTFVPPVNVLQLNSPGGDFKPAIRRGGEEIILASNRSGGLGGLDLWVARRDEQSAAWSVPENLGAIVNSTANDGNPTLSRDGQSLIFFSTRPGGEGATDLYVSTRTRQGRD